MWSEYFCTTVRSAGAGEQIVLALAQMEGDRGAARLSGGRLEGVLAFARALPAHRLVRREPGAAARERDPVGHDEGRVEADAELADELRVLRLVAGELRHELARPGLGDGPDVVDDLLPGHADAVVRDGDGARVGVHVDLNRQVRILFQQGGLGQRLEAQLVAGVRRVRDELAEEDLLVRVERMDHQIEELAGLGLEFVGGSGGCLRHVVAPASCGKALSRIAQPDNLTRRRGNRRSRGVLARGRPTGGFDAIDSAGRRPLTTARHRRKVWRQGSSTGGNFP